MARTKQTACAATSDMRRRGLRPLRKQKVQAAAAMSPPLARNTRVLRSDTARAASASKVTKPTTRRRRADPWAPKRKVNPNATPRAPPPTHFSCRICIEEQPVDQFVRWLIPYRRRWRMPSDVPYNCIAHLARNPRKKNIDPVCKSCIGNAMSARLDTLGARKVGAGCLEPGCDEPWSHDYVMRYIPTGEPLEKFNMEMFNVWLEDATPKPMTCLSPTCNAIGVPDMVAPGYPQITCYECSFRSCAQCLVPWHKDVTCAEHAAKHINEQMSDPEKDTLKLMQTKDGKRCPNCYLVIEKDGGCDSMLCLGCHKYFNWSTAASAVPGAKKAEPFVYSNPYWHPNNGPVICEMDRISGIAGAGGAPVAVVATS
ncbi:Nn.00g006990.m01.CDS01 [Neocucurbitaria sp. VM-36]